MLNSTPNDNACSTLDVVGATASALCAIHCIAMPILLATLPALGLRFLLSHNVERGFVIGAVILAIANTCWGFRTHRKTRVIWLAVIGGLFLLIATFGHSHATPDSHACQDHAHHAHEHHEEESRPQSSLGGLSMLLGGAAFLISAHFLNRRFCKSCHHCHHHDEASA
jgi:hypothetical protein